MSLEPLIRNVALVAFTLASVLYLFTVQESERVSQAAKAAFASFVVATLAITTAALMQLQGVQPLTLSALLLSATIGWLTVIGHLRFKMRLLGTFVAPLATLILLLQFFFTPGQAIATEDRASELLITCHVVMAILGQAFTIIACAVSILYLWQQNLLKKRRLNQLAQHLPAIDRVDRLLLLSLWSGFIFITLGLLTGAIYTQLYSPPDSMRLSAKVIWATAVWLWYLATLLAKNVFGRPSKRIAQMCLAGFILMAVSYFGMGFLRSGGP